MDKPEGQEQSQTEFQSNENQEEGDTMGFWKDGGKAVLEIQALLKAMAHSDNTGTEFLTHLPSTSRKVTQWGSAKRSALDIWVGRDWRTDSALSKSAKG